MLWSILAPLAISRPTGLHKLSLIQKRDTSLPFYYPDTVSRYYHTPASFTFGTLQSNESDLVEFAKSELIRKLAIPAPELHVTQHYTDSGIFHLYGIRIINGVPVDNHNCGISIHQGRVLSIWSSFQKPRPVDRMLRQEKITLDEAIELAEQEFAMKKDSFPAKLVLIQVPSGELVYAHQFQLRDDIRQRWYQVSVDSNSGQVIQVIDYVNEFLVRAIPLQNTNPLQGFENIVSTIYEEASPRGWNDDGTKYTNTQGNNIDSRIGSTERADGGANLNFMTSWDATKEPTTPENRKAAIVNNFYISNVVHDISYVYGFTEAAGNFQTNNFGKGGLGNDRVLINNQAPGANNANFMTPPDGQTPIMNMFLWTFSSPQRDGSLENGIPIHEYTHGISNRLTGGSAQANCLTTIESGGLGEAWSDTLAFILQRKPGENREMDVVLGDYSYNNPGGIRSKPYSTNMTRNPYTFSYLRTVNQVHAIGELWATTMYDMYWNLVDEYGFSQDWYDATQMNGNIIALKLIFGGLK
jgi:extracellular elastinolytic metalloproteinase